MNRDELGLHSGVTRRISKRRCLSGNMSQEDKVQRFLPSRGSYLSRSRRLAVSLPLTALLLWSFFHHFHILSSQSVALPALERALQSALLPTLSLSAPLNLLGFLPSQAHTFLLENRVDLPLCDFFPFSIKLSYI